LGARKPKGLNRIAKVWEQVNKGSKQDSQSLGASKPKGLNRIAKDWEKENQRVKTV
jgi:phage-related protein